MSNIMRGLGLAHTLAQALENSQASSGTDRSWSDSHINALTTRKGKAHVLGPMLDVLRGDAEIVPKKRVIDTTAFKPGDPVPGGKIGDVIVRNQLRFGNWRMPRYLVNSDFVLGIASLSLTRHYNWMETQALRQVKPKNKNHIDVPEDRKLHQLNRRHLLPQYLVGQKLPGLALLNFYRENLHHLPQDFPESVLFWGTVCKNDWCYYVPGLYRNGDLHSLRICTYTRGGDDKDVLSFETPTLTDPYDAAVLI